MQKLEVSLSIHIPEHLVVITKVELEQLKQNELNGLYWNMKDLEEKTTRKSEWIKENILYPTRFRKILDAESGGFVFYPKSKGQTWVFQASEMANFLDKNFSRIFKT
jgi:phage pi2 protein 07